jgi:hypothetical protein
MKVSCDQGVASQVGPESCVDVREGIGEALTGESAGRVLSLENCFLWGADAVLSGGRQQRTIRFSEARSHPTWSQTPGTHRSISRARRSLLYEGTPLRNGSREISGTAWTAVDKLPEAHVRAVNPKGAKRR